MKTPKLGRRAKYGLVVLPSAAALVALAGAPASAAQWYYNIQTTDSHHGGNTIGSVTYTSIGHGCYNAHIDGNVSDTRADGYSVIVYLRGRVCGSGRIADIESGYVAGKGHTKSYGSGWANNVFAVTARVCLYKNSHDYYCKTAHD
ncbi:hypothetical protein ACQB60_06135 [Actinomycetota bacterium Odt1-20B]